jgi:hypothetical protein
MADKKISQLTALAAANVAPATDVLAIVDTSATETKKITAKDLIDGALNGGTANGVLYLNGSKVATSGSALTFDGTNFASTGSLTGSTLKTTRASGAQPEIVLTQTSVASWSIYNPPASTDLRFYNGSDLLTLLSSGNVGIGTSSPVTKLQVSGTNATVTLSDTNASGGSYSTLLFRNTDGLSTAYNIASIYGLTTANGGNGALTFYTAASNSNTEKMRLDSSGNLGIGTTSPGARLSVTNSNATSPTAEFGGNQVREFVRTGTQSSDGTIRVDIAFTSQGSNWSSQLIEIAVSTSAGGSSSRYGGVVRYVLTSLTDLQGPTALASDLTGLTVATAFSGMEFRVTFSTTGGNIDLYCVHVRVLSSNTSAPATSVVIS